jgi:hypothetical protein
MYVCAASELMSIPIGTTLSSCSAVGSHLFLHLARMMTPRIAKTNAAVPIETPIIAPWLRLSPTFRNGIGFQVISGRPLMDLGVRKERMQRNKSHKMDANHYYVNNMNDLRAENRISQFASQPHPGRFFQMR